jgi:hypothetical protein
MTLFKKDKGRTVADLIKASNYFYIEYDAETGHRIYHFEVKEPTLPELPDGGK